MKKYLVFLTFFILSCDSDIQQNQILKFQKNLVDIEQTGSNVAMVYKDDKIVYNEIFNSQKEGGIKPPPVFI